MRFDIDSPFGSVHDANGVEIVGALRGDTDTGLVQRMVYDADGSPKLNADGTGFVKVVERHPAPLYLKPSALLKKTKVIALGNDAPLCDPGDLVTDIQTAAWHIPEPTRLASTPDTAPTQKRSKSASWKAVGEKLREWRDKTPTVYVVDSNECSDAVAINGNTLINAVTLDKTEWIDMPEEIRLVPRTLPLNLPIDPDFASALQQSAQTNKALMAAANVALNRHLEEIDRQITQRCDRDRAGFLGPLPHPLPLQASDFVFPPVASTEREALEQKRLRERREQTTPIIKAAAEKALRATGLRTLDSPQPEADEPTIVQMEPVNQCQSPAD